MGTDRLIAAMEWAARLDRPLTLDELAEALGSAEPSTRLRALAAMRHQIESGVCDSEFLRLADATIEDADNDCRWQAMIIVGEFIDERPQEVWRIAEQYGCSPDDDMRAAVATVLLEHLIERRGATMKEKAQGLASRSELFADTLRMCATFDNKSGG